MEFITVEQFQEQPKEVQKVFIDWWKCDYGDLYYYNENPLKYKDFKIIDNELECEVYGDFDYFKKTGVIPIFTEGQLRGFIEDKTSCKNIELEGNIESNQYDLFCFKEIWSCYEEREYNKLGTNVLQAYWKVACEIAKELVN